MAWSPCSEVTVYSAFRAGDSFIIIASGTHPNGGYKTKWTEINPQRCPPDLAFVHEPPVAPQAGPEAFVKCSPVYECKDSTRTDVKVKDGEGVHNIPVQSVPSLPLCPETLLVLSEELKIEINRPPPKKMKKKRKRKPLPRSG